MVKQNYDLFSTGTIPGAIPNARSGSGFGVAFRCLFLVQVLVEDEIHAAVKLEYLSSLKLSQNRFSSSGRIILDFVCSF